MTTITTPDFAAIKKAQNASWSSGDYATVGTTLQIVGETLAEAANLKPGSRVLDVAAGNGNATLAFARRWNRVVSTDYVPSLLERGRARANAEGLEVDFCVADAENLPFGNNTFDGVVSTFGVMFTPDQSAAATELVRVCRTDGVVGLANWTPESFIGQLFKVLGQYRPPPAGVNSPALWGQRAWLQETFGSSTSRIGTTSREFVFRYRDPQHFMEVFKTLYGPVQKAFEALDVEGQRGLEGEMLDLIHRMNTASDGSMAVASEYLEVLITK
ncbi:MAG: class I SAM-dependent methyltransferase [Planctomycetota bacterium]